MFFRKRSISREIEQKHLSQFLNQLSTADLQAIVDLGGENNHYNNLLRTYSQKVITFNLPEKRPDQIVDLTKPFIDLLLMHNPDVIVSVNTVEHLIDDSIVFNDVIKYLSLRRSQALIICPFLYRIHAAPFDFRRYTHFGIERMLGQHIQHINPSLNTISFKIVPIGGHWTVLIKSIINQQSYLLGLLASPLLHLIFAVELFLRIFRKSVLKRNTKTEVFDYALGYAIEIYSS